MGAQELTGLTSAYIPLRDYEFSAEVDKLFPSFINFQSEIGTAKKTSQNPFYKSRYADLAEVWAAISEPLKKNGLAVFQLPSIGARRTVKIQQKIQNKNEKLVWNGKYDEVDVDEIVITTMLIHTSTQYLKCRFAIVPDDDSPQSRGKAITYGRRYTIMSILGVCPDDDDDGNPTPRMPDQRQPSSNPRPADNSSQKQRSIPSGLMKEGDVVRFDNRTGKLNEEYQKDNGLITNEDFMKLKSALDESLGPKKTNFHNWLLENHNIKFYDIPKNLLPEIMKVVSEDPDSIGGKHENEF